MITIDMIKDKTCLNFISTDSRYKCRQSGKVKAWKTSPEKFKIPVKYGLYQSFYITNENANDWEII